MRNLALLPQSYEAPAEWFQILKNHLQIRKGALLLPDLWEGVLSAWASTGYDRTTYFRLRIPTSYIYDLFHRTPSSLVHLKREQITALEPYFSSREFGLINSLLVQGIFFKDRLIGALLISDSTVLQMDQPVLSLFFTVLDEISASLLYEFRTAQQEKLKGKVFFDPDAFSNTVAPPEGIETEGILYKLDTQSIIRTFQMSNPELDMFRIIRDIAYFISTLMEGAAVLIHPTSSNLYLFKKEVPRDIELLNHQLEVSLKSLFPELAMLSALLRYTKVRLPISDPVNFEAITF